MQRQLKVLHFQQTEKELLPKQLPQRLAASSVARRAASDLSYRDFIEEYAQKKTPLIITGAVTGMLKEKWSFEYLEERLGNHIVPLKMPTKDSIQWPSLEDAGTMPAKEFLQAVKRGKSYHYLFDYSLPSNRPDLAEE